MELRTALLLLFLSVMAHAVQVTLPWEPSHSSLDLNKYVKMLLCFFDKLDSEDSNNERKKAATLLVKVFNKCL